MGTGNLLTARSDLPFIYNIAQLSLFRYTKELFIALIREYFSQDSYYHFDTDAWGFPLITDKTFEPIESGLHDSNTSRIYIGEKYSYKIPYLPSVLVSATSSKYVPLDISRNKDLVYYKSQVFEDGYGKQRILSLPDFVGLSGVFEGEIVTEVYAKSIIERDEIVDLLMIFFADIFYEEFARAGVLIRPSSAGGFNEIEDRAEKIYKASINSPVRTEWMRKIPITNVVENILFCIEFANLEVSPIKIAENLTIKTQLGLIDQIIEIENIQ